MSPLRRSMGGTGRRLRRQRAAERHESFAFDFPRGGLLSARRSTRDIRHRPLRSAQASAIAMPHAFCPSLRYPDGQ